MSNSNALEESNQKQLLNTYGAIGILIVNMTVVLIYVFSLCLILKMVKTKDLLIGKLLGSYAKFNLIYAPFAMVIFPAVIELSPLSAMFGHWFSDIIAFATRFGVYFDATISFVIACTIYMCCIHKDRIDKQFVVNLFCAFTFVVPLIMVIFYTPVQRHQSSVEFAWINECYGRQAGGNSSLCFFDDHILYQQYGNWTNVAKTSLQILCWIDASCTLFFMSNVSEAIIYLLLYSHFKRYV